MALCVSLHSLTCVPSATSALANLHESFLLQAVSEEQLEIAQQKTLGAGLGCPDLTFVQQLFKITRALNKEPSNWQSRNKGDRGSLWPSGYPL